MKEEEIKESTDTPKRHLRRRLTLPLKIVIVTTVFLIISGGVFGFFILRQDSSPTDQVKKPVVAAQSPAEIKAAKQAGRTLDPSISTDAAKARASGNSVAAVAVYDDALKSNDDNDEKVALYIQKAVLQAALGDVNAAIESAKQAELLAGQTLATTTLLASLYQQVGNKSEAATYFRLAAKLVVENVNSSSVGDKQYYLDTAAALEASL